MGQKSIIHFKGEADSILRAGAPIVVVIDLVKWLDLPSQSQIPAFPAEWDVFKRVPKVLAL